MCGRADGGSGGGGGCGSGGGDGGGNVLCKCARLAEHASSCVMMAAAAAEGQCLCRWGGSDRAAKVFAVCAMCVFVCLCLWLCDLESNWLAVYRMCMEIRGVSEQTVLYFNWATRFDWIWDLGQGGCERVLGVGGSRGGA